MVDLDHAGARHSHIPLHDCIHALIWQESILMIPTFNRGLCAIVIHFMFELYYIEFTVKIFVQLTSVINL